MAYDKENRRLYVDESSDKGGIALWQIADCLRYYKRDKNGKRNLGTIIKNADINKWAKYKPVSDPTPANLLDNVPLGYRGNGGKGTCGIDYVKYGEYDVMGGLVSDDVNVADRPYFGELVKSRTDDHERSEVTPPYRALDFDGYDHLANTLWNVQYPYITSGRPDEVNFSQFVVGTYAYANAISNSSPSTLTLIDIMQGLKDESGNLVVYAIEDGAEISAYSFARDFSIDEGDSYGYIGVLATVRAQDGRYKGVAFCSKSVGQYVGDDLNTFQSNIGNVIDALGAVGNEDTLMLVPVVTNYNTNLMWIMVGLGGMPHFKAIPFPMNRLYFKEYDLLKKPVVTIDNYISTYPETAHQGYGRVKIPGNVTGGVDLIITNRLAGTLYMQFMQGTKVLGEASLSLATGTTERVSVALWQDGNTSSMLYKATGDSKGLYNRVNNGGNINVYMSYSPMGTFDSRWAYESPIWSDGTTIQISM